VRDKHGHTGAILGFKKDLLGLEQIAIKVLDLGLLKDREAVLLLLRSEVVTVDGRGVQERGEGKEHLLVLATSSNRADGTDGDGDFVREGTSLEIVNVQDRLHVMHVLEDQLVLVDNQNRDKDILDLGNDINKSFLWLGEIVTDNFATGRIFVGLEVEDGAVVGDTVSRCE